MWDIDPIFTSVIIIIVIIIILNTMSITCVIKCMKVLSSVPCHTSRPFVFLHAT